MNRTFAYINTTQGVSLYIDDDAFDLDRSWQGYDGITAILSNTRDVVISKLDELKTLAQSLIAAARGIVARATNLKALRVEGSQVFFKDKALPDEAASRIVRMFTEGQDLAFLETFFENLYQNPSFRAVQGLYTFLEYGKMPITDDGHFLAYKAIRTDWTDIKTGTFNNSIGKSPEMPRNEVDEEPSRTCSNGLHVCSHEYLPNFAHAEGHVVVVKINPKDVVSIPTDYNNTKMRVCRYEVLREVPGWYSNRRDELSKRSVEQLTIPAAPAPAPYTGCGTSWQPHTVVADDVEKEVEDEQDDIDFKYEVQYYDGDGWEYHAETWNDEPGAIGTAQELEETYRRVRVMKIDDSSSDEEGVEVYHSQK